MIKIECIKKMVSIQPKKRGHKGYKTLRTTKSVLKMQTIS